MQGGCIKWSTTQFFLNTTEIRFLDPKIKRCYFYLNDTYLITDLVGSKLVDLCENVEKMWCSWYCSCSASTVHGLRRVRVMECVGVIISWGSNASRMRNTCKGRNERMTRKTCIYTSTRVILRTQATIMVPLRNYGKYGIKTFKLQPYMKTILNWELNRNSCLKWLYMGTAI